MIDIEKELGEWRHFHFDGRRDEEHSGEYLERVSQLDLANYFYERTKKEYESLPKIHGWVARDKYGSLNLFGDKPTRFEDDTFGNIKGSGMIFLNDELLPEVTWESEPVEVELLIRKVESTKQV